jgi:hypothetical protein
MPNPQLTIYAYFVPHGYELEYYDIDGKNIGHTCRDFGSDYSVEYIKMTAVAQIAKAFENLENNLNNQNQCLSCEYRKPNRHDYINVCLLPEEKECIR